MQGVEIGDALYVQHADLAVDDELLLAHLECGLDDERKPPCPVEAGLRLHVAGVADDAPAVAIAFAFVNPIGAARDCLCQNGLAIRKITHGRHLCTVSGNTSLSAKRMCRKTL
jgi:hypothetical protein